MIQLREHRGGLEDSMQTLVLVADRDELVRYCLNVLDMWVINPPFTAKDVHIVEYSPYADHRIGWKRTSLVLIDKWGVFGMTDADPD